MKQFLWMGGYWPYVWSSYSLVFIVLFANWFSARSQHRKQIFQLQREQRITASCTQNDDNN